MRESHVVFYEGNIGTDVFKQFRKHKAGKVGRTVAVLPLAVSITAFRVGISLFFATGLCGGPLSAFAGTAGFAVFCVSGIAGGCQGWLQEKP